MPEIKSLSINNEVARIEKFENETKFYICDCDYLQEVDRKAFKEFLKQISLVCLTSWDKSLKQNYIEFIEYFISL